MNEVFPNAFRPKARNPARATCKINSVRINFLAMSSEPSTPAIPPELVERMQNQEPAAFEEFLEQYGTNLMRKRQRKTSTQSGHNTSKHGDIL
ncbi:MAG: hypothetical protein P8018_14005, partial [Acidobacteriota bacterium]